MVRIEPLPADQLPRHSPDRADEFCCATLDSAPAEQANPWSRWSYRPGPAKLHLHCDGRTHQTQLRSAIGIERTWDNPLQVLEWLGAQAMLAPRPGPPFKTGWIGYLSYDLGRLFEAIPATSVDDLNLPLFEFTWHDQVIAIDHAIGRAFDISCVADDMPALPIAFPREYTTGSGQLESDFSRSAYERAVSRAIEYIAAGDIFQVNLSQRFTAPLPDRPGAIYDRLLASYPAWFGAYLDFGDHALLCNSPELFLRITPSTGSSRRIITRPIKGTRPRGPGMDRELKDAIKDQAELNMIVDLERNDLGRICRTGSVSVSRSREIEAHPSVYHGVAQVEGDLAPGVGLVEVLRAAFPGGSITGAPKIRAMQIIDELERHRRGPYCGAIGFLSADGNIDLNIAIRTMIATQNRVHIPVGGGIVADSAPADEYQETLVKARAMLSALGYAPPRL